jgi:hypothetical protein
MEPRDEVLETWLDLGVLWAAWVWRDASGANAGSWGDLGRGGSSSSSSSSSGGGGLLWRLPGTDAAAGLAALASMARDDAESAAADVAARAAAATKDPHQTHACVSGINGTF